MTSPPHNSYLLLLEEVATALSSDIMPETLAFAGAFRLEKLAVGAGLAFFTLDNILDIHQSVLLFYFYFIITGKPDNCLSYLNSY